MLTCLIDFVTSPYWAADMHLKYEMNAAFMSNLMQQILKWNSIWSGMWKVGSNITTYYPL